jgi:Zn-dependent protease/predicted transcriptional regulator
VERARSPWVLELGRVAKIPVRVHLTFLLLIVWLAFGSVDTKPLHEALFVMLVFLCVLLHELGHALVARRFGVQTRDITLYPFGGIATLLSQPSPKAELVISLAGPIVNVLLAAALFPFVTIPSQPPTSPTTVGMLERLFMTNIALAVFNLLPALPMDGGRVLRAILNLCKVNNPTLIAARVSQGICFILAIVALALEQPMLFVIAFIIFFAAIQEYVRAESKVVAVAFHAQDAMIPKSRLETIPHGTTISKALRTALTSLQPLYPVMVGSELLGVVQREEILQHAASQPDEYVSAIMNRSIPKIQGEQPLSEAFTLLEDSGSPAVMVHSNGEFTGLLVPDRVAEFILLTGIRQHHSKDDDAEWSMPL